MKPSFAHAVGAQGSSHLTQSHFSMVVLKEQCRDQNSMSTRLPCRGDVEHLISLLRKPSIRCLPFITTTTKWKAGHDEIAERVQRKWTTKERRRGPLSAPLQACSVSNACKEHACLYSRLKRKKTRSSERTTVSCAGFVIVTCVVDWTRACACIRDTCVARHACHCI